MEQSHDARALRQLTSLLDGAHLATPDSLPRVVEEAGEILGWQSRIYLVDYAQRCLVPLPVEGIESPPSEDVEGTLAGRAFCTVEPVSPGHDPQPRLWVPLLDGVERLGVIDLRFPTSTNLDDDRLRAQIRWFSHLVGHLIAAKSPYGDSFHRTRGAQRRSVASELIWSLLPPLTMASERVVIAGLLEPSERVAGDVFDYAVRNDVAHVGMFDATGHNMHSSVIGSLALAAYRNGRRRQDELPTLAARIDSTLIDYAPDTYASGVVGELDLDSGVFRYLNAGHPSPLLLRQGRVVKSLDAGRRILLGFSNRTGTVAEERLEPGDVIVFYTDGVVEARDQSRDFFGLDRFIEILEHSASDGQLPPETLRRVVQRVLEHQHDVLQDDASVLILAWNTKSAQEMTAD